MGANWLTFGRNLVPLFRKAFTGYTDVGRMAGGEGGRKGGESGVGKQRRLGGTKESEGY